MRRRKLLGVLTGCGMAMLSSAAFAQGSPGGGAGASGMHSGSAGQGQGDQEGRLGSSARQTGQSQIMFRASRLVGMNVVSPQGQELGKLVDVVFHPEIGIVGVVQTPSGRAVPIPWQLVSDIKGQNLVFNTTLQALNGAPAMAGGQWASFNNSSFTHEIYAYFGVPSQGRMAVGAFRTRGGQGAFRSGQGGAGAQGGGTSQGAEQRDSHGQQGCSCSSQGGQP